MVSPNTKVTAGALAGAAVTIIIWILEATMSTEIPAAVAAALVVVVSFGLSYFIKEPAPEPPA